MKPEFAEDAPEPLASEREARLQACRVQLPATEPWGPGDLATYEWACELAAAGHVGAARLVERLAFPALRARVGVEAAKPAPDVGAVLKWLDDAAALPGDEDFDVDILRQIARNVAASLREVHRLAGPSRTDCATVAGLLPPGRHGSVTYHRNGEPDADTVFALARARLDAGEPGAERLLERAADLGCLPAQDAVFRRSGDAAILARWLDKERGPAVELAVRELREADGINERDLKVLTSARYLGLAGGPGAVERTGQEPYAACMLYTLALHRGQADPARWRLLERAAATGSRRAQLACYRREPDTGVLCRQLESGGEPAAAAALRELESLQPSALQALERTNWGVNNAGSLLYVFAKAGGDAQLVKRAAQLGSPSAAKEVVTSEFERAADKRVFVRLFLERYPSAKDHAQMLLFRLGAALEAENFDEASSWYALALGKPATAGGEFCFDTACRFDRRYRVHRIDDPARALAWFGRAIDEGYALALIAALEVCTRGELDQPSDPATALAFARRWPGSEFPRQARGLVLAVVEKLLPREERPAGRADDVEIGFWRAICDGSDADDFELYLQQFPNGAYAVEAVGRLRQLGREVNSPLGATPVQARVNAEVLAKWREVLEFLD